MFGIGEGKRQDGCLIYRVEYRADVFQGIETRLVLHHASRMRLFSRYGEGAQVFLGM